MSAAKSDWIKADDPNFDILDQTIEIDGKPWAVLWTTDWSNLYVELTPEGPGPEIITRPAGVVRRSLQLAG